MIAATNIVETSITLERLVCVIDSGMFKEASYNATSGITVLSERCISEAQRGQRVGRVGRIMDGFAYTIDLEGGKARSLQQRPEIQRTDLKQSILQLKDYGVDLERIQAQLPQKPDSNDLADALRVLAAIGAIDNLYHITSAGKRLLRYPNVDPVTGYVLDQLVNRDSSKLLPAAIAYAILQQQEDFAPALSPALAERTFTPESDLATLVKCYLEAEKSANPMKFCAENGLNRKVFGKIRFRVCEIYGAVRENNPDAFIDNAIDADSDDSEDDVSDAEPEVASAQNERKNREAAFRRELTAVTPKNILSTLDEYINELTNI